jgi:hypothetical protein
MKSYLRVEKVPRRDRRWTIYHDVVVNGERLRRAVSNTFTRRRDAVACLIELRALDDLDRERPRISRELLERVDDICTKWGAKL